MGLRATSSAVISFGMVAIPIKVYKATDSQKVSFKQINSKTGNLVGQKLYDKGTDDDVNRADIIKGYEVARDEYIKFTPEEIKSLESPSTEAFQIKEFVPIEAVDICQIENTHYLSPGKGGDGAYNLLSQSMKKEKKVAIGTWSNRGKDNLVMLRAHKNGIILHTLYFANEVRSFDDVNQAAKINLSNEEIALGCKLIKQLSNKSFDSSSYEDGYRDRVLKAVEQKKNGKKITLTIEGAKKANVIDLITQLKASIA